MTTRTTIRRYADFTRLNHWAVTMLFMCAGMTGMALFHPSLFFLSGLFGGGSWSRILHPYFGVLMVLGFVGLFFAMWRQNLWRSVDTAWVRRAGTLLRGDEKNMPAVGKYNAGQKAMFWIFGLSLAVLFITGFMFWRPWFAGFFPVPVRRVAVTLHAASAFVLVLSVIVHVYAAIWVKGSFHAMLRGTVSEEWARQHHSLWHKQVTGRD